MATSGTIEEQVNLEIFERLGNANLVQGAQRALQPRQHFYNGRRCVGIRRGATGTRRRARVCDDNFQLESALLLNFSLSSPPKLHRAAYGGAAKYDEGGCVGLAQ